MKIKAFLATFWGDCGSNGWIVKYRELILVIIVIMAIDPYSITTLNVFAHILYLKIRKHV